MIYLIHLVSIISAKNSSIFSKIGYFEADPPMLFLLEKTLFLTLNYKAIFYISIRKFYILLDNVQNKTTFFRLNVRILQRSGQSFFRLVEEAFVRSE